MLLFSLLNMLIIVVLFITLVNLQQSIYLKLLCLKLVGTYKNAYPRSQYEKSTIQLSFLEFSQRTKKMKI